MNSLDTVRTGVPPGASVDIPKTVVAEWTVGKREVCLFQVSDRLAFSTEGRSGRLATFRPEVFDIGSAINLIIMFRRTIAVNLEKEEPHSSCFLPKFCTVARDAPGMHVALFGRVDTRSAAAGDLKGMRWGIWDISRREEQVFEVNDAVAEEFVRYAPKTNAPHFVTRNNEDGQLILDANKQPAMFEGNDHYAMTTYAKRFDVVLERDSTGAIQNVRLVRTSIFDRTVWLDEHSWAITLVSQQTIRTGCTPSHAVIAYEGVARDNARERPFLSYIHIKARSRNWIKIITGQQAKVEVLDDETDPYLKWRVLVGPTRPRSSMDVERMISLAKQNGNVDFALLGAMEAPTIRGGGGLGVLAIAGWAARSFTSVTQATYAAASRKAKQVAYDVFLKPLYTVPLITEGVNRNINEALTISNVANSVKAFNMEISAIKKALYEDMALSRLSLASHVVLCLLIMSWTYTVAKNRSNRQNCLDWAINTVSRGGIIIRNVPSTVVTPSELMIYLRSHPSCIEVVQEKQ